MTDSSGEWRAGKSRTRHSPFHFLFLFPTHHFFIPSHHSPLTTRHSSFPTHHGPTAVQAALDHQPDVMLLDIGLPGLNGYEVAKRIRQEPTLRHIVLIALTGYGQDSDRQTSLEAGFNHHLVKPARLELLQIILASVSERMTRG